MSSCHFISWNRLDSRCFQPSRCSVISRLSRSTRQSRNSTLTPASAPFQIPAAQGHSPVRPATLLPPCWVLDCLCSPSQVRVCEAMGSPMRTLSYRAVLRQQDGGASPQQAHIYRPLQGHILSCASGCPTFPAAPPRRAPAVLSTARCS